MNKQIQVLRGSTLIFGLFLFFLAFASTFIQGNFNVNSARNFLIAQYDPQIGLIYEAPSSPNTFWVYNDNYEAYLALKGYNDNLANSLYAQIQQQPAARVIVLNGQTFDPITAGVKVVVVQIVSSKIIETEVPDPSTSPVIISSYGDIAAYAALNAYNHGDIATAKQDFNILELMWDGVGIHDATTGGGVYATFKTSLYLIAAHKIGVTAKYETQAYQSLVAAQNSQGGCRTGITSTGVLNGANTETTALCILAVQGSPTQSSMPSIGAYTGINMFTVVFAALGLVFISSSVFLSFRKIGF